MTKLITTDNYKSKEYLEKTTIGVNYIEQLYLRNKRFFDKINRVTIDKKNIVIDLLINKIKVNRLEASSIIDIYNEKMLEKNALGRLLKEIIKEFKKTLPRSIKELSTDSQFQFDYTAVTDSNGKDVNIPDSDGVVYFICGYYLREIEGKLLSAYDKLFEEDKHLVNEAIIEVFAEKYKLEW